MTERTLPVSLTSKEVELLVEGLRETRGALEESDAEARASLVDKMLAIRETHFKMNISTKLYEDERVALFEHPVMGDEAPLMAYFKYREEFEEDTEMWEVSDVEEILENYESAFRSF